MDMRIVVIVVIVVVMMVEMMMELEAKWDTCKDYRLNTCFD